MSYISLEHCSEVENGAITTKQRGARALREYSDLGAASFIQIYIRIERKGLLGSREWRYNGHCEALRAHLEMRCSTSVHKSKEEERE